MEEFVSVIDASSKIPSGLLMGNNVDLGMYDECMAIREIANGEEIRGRHCMYTISVLMNNTSLQETLSICLPSTCEPKDVVTLLTAAFQTISDILPINIPITVQSSTCSVVDAPDWTPGGIATLFVFFPHSSAKICFSDYVIIEFHVYY